MVTDEGRSWKWVGIEIELKWNGFVHNHRRSLLVFEIRKQEYPPKRGRRGARNVRREGETLKILRSGRGTK